MCGMRRFVSGTQSNHQFQITFPSGNRSTVWQLTLLALHYFISKPLHRTKYTSEPIKSNLEHKIIIITGGKFHKNFHESTTISSTPLLSHHYKTVYKIKHSVHSFNMYSLFSIDIVIVRVTCAGTLCVCDTCVETLRFR